MDFSSLPVSFLIPISTTAYWVSLPLKACAREKRIPFELTADPFYSSANQRYLEGIMRDVRSGKAHFAPHDLIEEA